MSFLPHLRAAFIPPTRIPIKVRCQNALVEEHESLKLDSLRRDSVIPILQTGYDQHEETIEFESCTNCANIEKGGKGWHETEKAMEMELENQNASKENEDNENNEDNEDNVNEDADENENGNEKLTYGKRSTFKSILNKFHLHRHHGHDNIDQFDSPIVSPLDNVISYAVRFTGSIYMFILMWILLIVWITIGAILKAPDNWQIVMQDGQSIQTYVWDTFLMRQQLDDTESFLRLYGRLKSRSLTHKRLLKSLKNNKEVYRIANFTKNYDKDDEFQFKSLTWFDKVSNKASEILGSLPSVVIYWIGIFIWIGCGRIALNDGTADKPNYSTFSNRWQMFINTATAVELLITSVFLENIRTRNNDLMRDQIELFSEFDSKLELTSRLLLDKDKQDNEIVSVDHCPRKGIQKYITLYSDIIGTGLGLIISVGVFAVWIAIGPTMKWNSNWWLIIGTYTGLAGFIDGFVLREVYFSITGYEEEKFATLLQDSQELLDIAGIQVELETPKIKDNWINRISTYINNICSNKWSVVVSIGIVISLIIVASAMKWSETGQLLANTPTMIIEGFFLLILIQAHNWADEKRSHMLQEVTKSRKLLYNYVKSYVPLE